MASERAVAIGSGQGGQRWQERNGALERLMTLPEVAELLRISPKSVRRLVASQRMPCVRIGRALRFQASDVLRWISARREA